MTRQRELILQILRQSDRHLTADEIFFLAKLKLPSIAMATVYNNLNAMSEAGVIGRVHTDGGADCFERTTEKHDHLLCDGCGELTDLPVVGLMREVEAAIGTEVRGYTLTIHYMCPQCRAKQAQ